MNLVLDMKINTIQDNETMLPYDTPLKSVLPFYLENENVSTICMTIKHTNTINIHMLMNRSPL